MLGEKARENGITRRNWAVAAIYGLWSIIGAALALPAAFYLFNPPRAKPETEWAEAGDISRLESDVPVEMVFRRNRLDGWRLISEKSTAWVVKRGEEIVAYGPQCTHLGCAYHWNDRNREFLCPCHTSTFALDGTVTSGPAPRPLDRYDVRVENNRLLVGDLRTGGERTG
jgi:menaquinol-cytochrome c reductase iron-sulfur subunit